jgi:hypothetical protein
VQDGSSHQTIIYSGIQHSDLASRLARSSHFPYPFRLDASLFRKPNKAARPTIPRLQKRCCLYTYREYVYVCLGRYAPAWCQRLPRNTLSMTRDSSNISFNISGGRWASQFRLGQECLVPDKALKVISSRWMELILFLDGKSLTIVDTLEKAVQRSLHLITDSSIQNSGSWWYSSEANSIEYYTIKYT